MVMTSLQAAQGYGLAKTALGEARKPDASTDEKSAAGAGAKAFEAAYSAVSTISQGETAAQALMTGGADPHSVVEALAAAELVVETAVVVRDKVVEAYQELLRMPV